VKKLTPSGATPGKPKGQMRFLLIGLLAAVALAALSFWPSGDTAGSSPAATMRSVAGRAAVRVAGPETVPVLNLGAGRGAMRGEVGRDVFRFYNSPTPTPTPIRPTPTPLPLVDYPRLPAPTATPTPIVPPNIPFKAIGRFGPRERPIVTLEGGGRLINAREGDVVDGRFVVHKINRESVDFSFTGLPPDITRRLPIPLP
jgi:hypothetical protein